MWHKTSRIWDSKWCMKQRYSKRKYYLPVGVSCGWWPQPPVCLGTSDPGEADPLLGDDQLGVLRGEGDRGPHRGERGGGRHQPWKYRHKIGTFLLLAFATTVEGTTGLHGLSTFVYNKYKIARKVCGGEQNGMGWDIWTNVADSDAQTTDDVSDVVLSV